VFCDLPLPSPQLPHKDPQRRQSSTPTCSCHYHPRAGSCGWAPWLLTWLSGDAGPCISSFSPPSLLLLSFPPSFPLQPYSLPSWPRLPQCRCSHLLPTLSSLGHLKWSCHCNCQLSCCPGNCARPEESCLRPSGNCHRGPKPPPSASW
jgi:hypothetical protein